MWTYIQKTGEFLHDGQHVAFGYAGRDYDDAGNFVGGKNNPEMQSVKGIGPLPVGLYRSEPPTDDPVVGRYALRLVPDPSNEMYGRSSFFLHGDSAAHPGQASHGCIVQGPAPRREFWDSDDHDIRVQSGV